MERYGDEPLHIEVTPEREFDVYGRPFSAVVLGEERRIAPHTAAQEAAKQIAQAAYGVGTSLDAAEALRSKNTRPFQHMNDGRGVVAHSHLGTAELPQRLLPAAQPVNTVDMTTAKSARLARSLSQFEAAKALADRGVAMGPELVAVLRRDYKDGVPEDQLDALQARLTVRASLRMVAGGAS